MLNLARVSPSSRSHCIGVVVLLLGGVPGCKRAADQEPASSVSESAAPVSAPAPGKAKQEVLVFAASSLTNVFGELEKKFEGENPNTDVVLNLAGSQALRVQIENGAPVDVFASANTDHMQVLQKAELMGENKLLAENELVVAVPEDNPAHLQSFADLPRAKRIVLGAPEVPVGSYTKKLLERASKELGPDFQKEVDAHVVSREANVRLVLAKVELGEADAAIVYRTDVSTARKVKMLPIRPGLAEKTKYDIAAAERAPHPELAVRWLTYVTGPTGHEALSRAGFIVSEEPPVAR